MRNYHFIHPKIILYYTIVLFSCKKHKENIINTIKLENSKLSLSIEADSLDVPWDLQYDRRNNYIIFPEIHGHIKKLDLKTKTVTLLKTIPNVFQQRTTGLLGMALYQPYKSTDYLFLSFTSKNGNKIYSNLYRYIYTKEGNLESPKLLLQIPGNTGHNGSRIIIGIDQKIYWATGDAATDTYAQDTTSLNGKILRINIDGSIPEDNPIANSYIYAWGFRNMQGLTQNNDGLIYTSEHGDAVEDEINIIKPKRNYGWPLIEGKYEPKKDIAPKKQSDFTAPIKSWTPVIAPAGLEYYSSNQIPEWKNSLILTTLKSQSLRILKLSKDGKTITDEYTLFENLLGRLRSVISLPNGDIYFCSSNRDWNPQKGFPKNDDDKIYKLSATDETIGTVLSPVKTKEAIQNIQISGEQLYTSYCSSCHKADGSGVLNTFPALANSKLVNGDIQKLLNVILNGSKGNSSNGIKYDSAMPSFSFLKDEEITAIINYIRTNFNNNSSTTEINQLKQIKKSYAIRN